MTPKKEIFLHFPYVFRLSKIARISLALINIGYQDIGIKIKNSFSTSYKKQKPIIKFIYTPFFGTKCNVGGLFSEHYFLVKILPSVLATNGGPES